MAIELKFSTNMYKEIANKNIINYDNGIMASDAFMLLINGLEKDELHNICLLLQEKLNYLDLSIEDCYELTQSNNDYKDLILETAYETIEKFGNIGIKMNGTFNTTSFISHSLYEGKCASILAKAQKLNPDVAMKLGILHDIGRKIDQSFNHVIKGFEYLVDQGLNDEAFCCLTHSFVPHKIDGVLKGGRCCTCDEPPIGFYVDHNGIEQIPNDSKDDLYKFLEGYQFNDYDILLNISDLMATADGITSPYERVADIRTRKPAGANESYFLSNFISIMQNILYNEDVVGPSLYMSMDKTKLNEIFQNTSNEFIDYFNNINSIENSLK